MKRYFIPDPVEGAHCTLQPDSLAEPLMGVPDIHPDNGDACFSFDVPTSVPNKHGAWLRIWWTENYAPYELHGFLDTVNPSGGFEPDIYRGQKVVNAALPRLVVRNKFLAQDDTQ